ncbi:MAG TPA: hypothetical protein VKR42_05425 [Ktedonobacteraceae bacterium]|nr:hypothetical protein [Ktedonobacteraceae bacterium]
MPEGKFFPTRNMVVAILVACFVMIVLGAASASSGPALTEALTAGPYSIDVNLYQNPPPSDQLVEVTVVPHDTSVPLTGSIVVEPGLGTDAVPLHFTLAPLNQTSTLITNIRMPVRGSWQVVVQLNGPKGPGSASFLITVAGPGAIPVWLAWLIALVPTPAIVWLIWHQYRYRQRLLVQAKSNA